MILTAEIQSALFLVVLVAIHSAFILKVRTAAGTATNAVFVVVAIEHVLVVVIVAVSYFAGLYRFR